VPWELHPGIPYISQDLPALSGAFWARKRGFGEVHNIFLCFGWSDVGGDISIAKHHKMHIVFLCLFKTLAQILPKFPYADDACYASMRHDTK
jgi:hypothetical protein